MAKRVSGFGTSVFSEFSRLATQHGAVNLGQGFPDFPAPDFVKEAVARHVREDRNQYAPSHGVPRVRKAIAHDWQRRYGRLPDAESEVTVASGATELLWDAILALVDPGDEVILFEPFYDCYLPDLQVAGGVPKVVRLEAPDWRFDRGALERAFSSRTRLIVLNTPHNPTGKLYDEGELAFIADLAKRHDALVLADEVYAEIVYPPARHVPIALLPGMWERTLTLESMGKTFSVTGFKIGWAVGPEPLTRALRAAHQFVTFSSATPLQEALADAFEVAPGLGYFDQMRHDYAARRDRLTAALSAAGLPPFPIQGGYFLVCDVAGRGFPDDTAFCRHLTAEVGVAAIPPSSFYLDPATAPLHARFCFAKRDATLDDAAVRLRRLAERSAR